MKKRIRGNCEFPQLTKEMRILFLFLIARNKLHFEMAFLLFIIG